MKEKITKLISIKELKQKKIKRKFKNVYNIHKSTGKTKKKAIILKSEPVVSPEIEKEILTPEKKTKKRTIILND